jgi:uncharacterized protein
MTGKNQDAASINKQTVTRFMAQFCAQKLDEPFTLIAPDAMWTLWGNSPAARDYSPAQMKELLAQSWTWFDGPVVWEPTLLVAEDDRVAVIARSKGTTLSGYVHQNHYHNLFRLSQGRIVHVREMFPEPPVQRLFEHLQNQITADAGTQER